MSALSMMCIAATSHAKDTLIWLLRDLPPSTIFSGPDEGKGAIDRLMPLLIARMPEYDHLLMRVNRARGTQMLKDGVFACDPTVLWTPERAKNIVFSIPTYAAFSNGLTVRKQDMAQFLPFVKDNILDLEALLNSNSVKVGVVAERSYGQVIDRILDKVADDELSVHYGSDAVGSLLQMERLGRLQGLISYWPEALYQARQQGIPEQDLTFLPVKGVPKYQFTHIGCADTLQGRQAMEIINREMRVLRETKLVGFYAQWIPSPKREEYLQDAKRFFEEPGK
ncbi:TIGR02285 family protein [Pseudomonas viridiflava]|uniref:TIGR02285 family protein n=1 Tax=Pseudomonas viridiflava TaxID=33069 RepID=UPI0013C29FD0|nr:TIGR02285 family protein [Pseudomonas viridiflava]